MQAGVSTVRFHARTSRDPGAVVHFKTSAPSFVSYFTGYGAPLTSASYAEFVSSFSDALPGHFAALPGAVLPAQASSYGSQANNELAMTDGLFRGFGDKQWQVKGSFTRSAWSVDDAANLTYSTLHQVWVRPALAPTVDAVAPVASLPTSCADVKAANSSALSGAYYFNVGGQPVRAHCDMETLSHEGESGGWMLVLNYVRGAGLQPTLLTRNVSDGLPHPRSTVLGADESYIRCVNGSWGHVDRATLAKVRVRTLLARPPLPRRACVARLRRARASVLQPRLPFFAALTRPLRRPRRSCRTTRSASSAARWRTTARCTL